MYHKINALCLNLLFDNVSETYNASKYVMNVVNEFYLRQLNVSYGIIYYHNAI